MVVPPSTGGNPPQTPTVNLKPPPSMRMNGALPTLAPPVFPYSARRAAPLDMNTVERKGHSSSRDPPQRNRPHGLPEAPTFRPTEAEFRDPMEYIRSISEKASKFGICKIIPPDSWNPDFAIDLERFHFRTRRQELNFVDGGNRTNLNYLDQLAKFHKQYGTHLNRFPSVDKRPLDLYKLKKAVEVRGGLEKVCKDKKWAEIGRDLGYSGKIMSSLSTSLKNSYQRWLHPYEEYLRLAKPGVHQQLEFEYGGAFSPSISQTQSPMTHPYPPPNPPPAIPSSSPAIQATLALNSSIESAEPQRQLPPPEPPRSISSSGFTAVNSSGFAAVNSNSGFTAVNQSPQSFVKIESSNPPPVSFHPGHPSPFQPVNSTAVAPTLSSGSPLTNGGEVKSNPLKRTMSHDSSNPESGSEGNAVDGENINGRRSKRARKEVISSTTETQAISLRASTPQRTRSNPRKHGEKCEACGMTDDKPNIVVCDSCEHGYHTSCLEPPLATMPDYDWHCSKCLVGTGDYGFEEGSVYSLKHFQEKANNFKEHYFAARMPFDPVTNSQKRATEDDVEREFWRLVENLTESVEVEYGADIHSTTHGSGFPTVEKNPLNPYSKDPWNLNVLPFHEESLFRHIKTDISGMTVPWLYVGMCFSTFCWHNEDHYAYSANFQHFGATKTWYGIPGKDAYAFETAMRQAVPELFETQPDLLFQLVTILPPDQLLKAGVEVFVLDQRAGQFVVTFPQAYHAGFNHGFNFNEAVNFAPADWEPFGEAGVARLQEFRRQPCFSHDELLLTAAASDTTIKTAKWLGPALQRMCDRELSQRLQFISIHQAAAPHESCVFGSSHSSAQCRLVVKVQNADLQEEEYQCNHCKAFSFMTQFRCHHTQKISCLLHTDVIDCCTESSQQKLQGPNHSLNFRYTDQELKNLVQKVVDKANVPEVWQAKLENLLDDEARPALRALHTLLSEGEKIPYQLSGLEDLADFVKRCDLWVEEANLYLTRKQQNRRKSEKAWRRSSVRGSKVDEKDSEPQLTLERMKELIADGEQLGFQAPQLENLQEKLANIDEWRSKVQSLLRGSMGTMCTTDELEALLEEGRGFMATMPELTDLDALHQTTKWHDDAHFAKREMSNQSLDNCKALLNRAAELQIPPHDQDILIFTEMVRQGDFWEIKAKEVMAAEDVHYPQLESLHNQVQAHAFPVNKEVLAQMDVILAKNREAKRQIITLVERSHDPDFRKRPMYVEVRDVVKALEDLNGKPHGTADLEKELKRHEDWMRKGKKLFGKANAPLHILEQHMKTVEERNNACFDLNDTFRPPVEPASREASPSDGIEKGTLGEDEKPVFCICRSPEAGLMIECEICHEWYHAKCLKLARGKVKETEMFTCPICDWRVKIPRDAARPKLEELQNWLDELPDLPFQPEEEELLKRIVDKAQAFRDFLIQYTNGNQLCRTIEEMPEMLFYLRKIEGAEVLLAYETNIFRQELHKWQPIAPEAPPVLEQSLSTRKPRPTKQQKLMRDLGVEKVEDLPAHLRTKQYIRRKQTESFVTTGPLLPKPSLQSPSGQGPGFGQSQIGDSSSTPLGMPRQASTGNPPLNGQYDPAFMPVPMSTPTPFGNAYTTSGPSSFPASTPSPMFSPTTSQPAEGLRDPMLSAFEGPAAGATSIDPAFPLFRPNVGLGLDGEDDIRNGLANVDGDSSTHVQEAVSSPQAGEYDNMFMEMTNQDPDTQNDGPILEHEASEALELIRNASQHSTGSNLVVGDDGEGEVVTSKDFDDFLTNGEEQP